jgi:hypothetical protein
MEVAAECAEGHQHEIAALVATMIRDPGGRPESGGSGDAFRTHFYNQLLSQAGGDLRT